MTSLGSRRPVVLGGTVLVVLVLVAAGVVAWLVLRDDGSSSGGDARPDREIPAAPPGAPVPWTGYAVAGGHVQVTYDGSVCQESSAAVATEHDDRVVVTVYAKLKPGVCVLTLARYDVSVDLDEPLGDRALYDGACLEQGHPTGTSAETACRRTPPA